MEKNTLESHLKDQITDSSSFLSYLLNEECVDDRLLEWGGRIAIEEKQWVFAEEIFSCLLERRRKPEDLVSLAHSLVRQNRWNEGEECLLEALNFISEPSLLLFCVYKNLGDISTLKKNFPLAEEFYNKAHTIRPNSLSLRLHRGILKLKQKNYNAAMECFQKLLKAQPKNEKAWLGLALSRKALGEDELAEGALLRSLDFNPKNPEALKLKNKWENPLLSNTTSINFHFSA